MISSTLKEERREFWILDYPGSHWTENHVHYSQKIVYREQTISMINEFFLKISVFCAVYIQTL